MLFFDPVMASNNKTLFHDEIGDRISAAPLHAFYLFKSRLAQNVACKYRPRLNVVVFKMFHYLEPRERGIFFYGKRECEPCGFDSVHLVGQEEVLIIFTEEFRKCGEVFAADCRISVEFFKLGRPDAGAWSRCP